MAVPTICEVCRKTHWGLTYAFVAILTALAAIAQNAAPAGKVPGADKTALPSSVQASAAKAEAGPNDQKIEQNAADPATLERRKQIADDSTRLLALAIALKVEVDKSNKDTLSLSVIRRADQIEKLAHTVKDKLRLTVGGS